MSEPLRTELADQGPLSEADRAARIEQLLLSGLDHYFGGDYEQAIHIWTRVAFLERGHGRARAYIERARGALAERHREAEECLGRGIDAYQAGAFDEARRLLTRVIDLGGANETALLFLQRLGHLDAVSDASRRRPRTPDLRASSAASRDRSASPSGWVATTAVSIGVVAVILIAALGTASWLREAPVVVQTGEPAPPDPLPTIRDSEIRVDRARHLWDGGRAHEALAELDQVQLGDPFRPQADQLKADIQRTLLSRVPSGGHAQPAEQPR